MSNLRRNFLSGRMEKDKDERLLQDGEYRHAENVLVLHSEGSDVGAVQNTLPNKKLTNIDFGTNSICLGGFADEATQKLYWLIKSDIGSYLLEYDAVNAAVSKVLEDTRIGSARVFDLKDTNFVTAINKILSGDPSRDLIAMNDDNMQPLCFNIEMAKAYGLNGFDKEDIFLIKKPPRFAPEVAPVLLSNGGNSIEEKFLSFSYRYKYLNGEYSALSSYSNYVFYPGLFRLDFEVLDNLGMVNSYNSVRVTINTGDKRVTDIQCVAKGSNSNNLYIIETFNKLDEGWGNNEARSFVFSNDKNYMVLPELELFRSFDNIPLKAKAQTVIGNRIVMGNFEEGYNLIDANNKKVKLNYNLSVISDSLQGNDLPLNYSNADGVTNNILSFNFQDAALKQGNRINFFISLDSNQTPASNFNETFSFLLLKDFVDAAELAQDPDFIYFFENYVTDVFLKNYSITDIPGAVLASNTTFTIDNYSSTSIAVKSIALVFTVSTVNQDVNWSFKNNTVVSYYKIGFSSSVKTNRSLEIGFVYLDEFNRETTVLTQLKNTIFIPQSLLLFKNRIKVSVNHLPPSFADRYKIVVKQKTLEYQTIYASIFYIEGLFRWVKLEGSNRDKIKEGDILIVKSDISGPLEEVIKVRVLELATIDRKIDAEADTVIKEAGRYMKIKPVGFNMNLITAVSKSFEGSSHLRYTAKTYTSPYFGTGSVATTDFVPFKIKAGSSVKIFIEFEARGSIAFKETYDKDFKVKSDYDSIKQWYDSEVITLGEFGEDFTREYGFTPEGEQFYVWSHRDGTASRNITTKVSFQVVFSEGILVFETEEKQGIEQEVYYQTAQTFEIVNGRHQGNLQNQTNLLPAEIDLDFFNCYNMGNGAESYIVKDAFNKPYLNIDLRPSIVTVDSYKAIRRYADLIYSEPYVESSNVNGLNVFNAATLNFKELDKQYGSIQKLHSRDNDILVLKEYKASKVMFEKGLLYNADGSSNVTASDNVLGPEVTYLGDNGIGKNPESFAENDFQLYYANTKQGSIVRLSIDGTTDIVDGMVDWFRDIFRTQPNAKKLGGFDPYSKQYFVSIGNEPEKILELQCNNTIIKNAQNGSFTYQLKLNNLSGDVVLNYNITLGNATIQAVFDGINHVVSNVNGIGNITFNRTSLLDNIVTVTVTAVSSSISYEIANSCPTGSELKIVSIVVNDPEDEGKNITNRFKWGSSSFYSSDDLFSELPVSKFLVESGIEGVGKFPLNNSVFTIESFKDSLASGSFLLTECNRIGYLVSDVVYSELDIDAILSSATFLSVSEISEPGFFETKSASFLFNRTEPDQILYLIWDYTNRKPILVNDSITVDNEDSGDINVLANDEAIVSPIVTIVTPPVNGTAIVNLNNTITYTHNGTETLTDTIVYQVSNGTCSSTAIINITINPKETLPTIPCSASASSGGEGVTEYTIALENPAGGIVIMDFNAQGVVDKLEIIHNGVKKATSGMTTPNSGPFDDLYGNPTVPTGAQAAATDQFIGTSKGAIPTREAVFLAETGITDVTRTKQQLIWFVYTAADYKVATSVIVRVTGIQGTAWDLIRLCTNQTPSVS
ncbi:Ig-like domain-containing protein [Flavobacterium sp. GNP002]